MKFWCFLVKEEIRHREKCRFKRYIIKESVRKQANNTTMTSMCLTIKKRTLKPQESCLHIQHLQELLILLSLEQALKLHALRLCRKTFLIEKVKTICNYKMEKSIARIHTDRKQPPYTTFKITRKKCLLWQTCCWNFYTDLKRVHCLKRRQRIVLNALLSRNVCSSGGSCMSQTTDRKS